MFGAFTTGTEPFQREKRINNHFGKTSVGGGGGGALSFQIASINILKTDLD